MSYSICKVSKIKESGITGAQIHNRREKDFASNNEEISRENTKFNYDLNLRHGSYKEIVKKRIIELEMTKSIRKDAIWMIQILITSDHFFFKDISEGERKRFFEESYCFLKNRYDEKNVVSCIVYLDTKTPHMLFNFVPITLEGRLSAKLLFNRFTLIKLQDDYNKFIRENGFDLKRGEKDSKRKSLDMEEYKIETKSNELKEKEIILNKRLEILNVNMKKINELIEILDTANHDVDFLKDKNISVKEKVQALNNILDAANNLL